MDAEHDRYDLGRFVESQRGIYAQVIAELSGGQKRSHWMWFIFPQIHGLGSSPMAVRYAISSLDEACAYLAHPVLGQRLLECTEIVNGLEADTSVARVFGFPDDLKFHSSMTLFAKAAPDSMIFGEALERYFGGASDRGTVSRLNSLS